MELTEPQKKAVAKARAALEAERARGALPGISAGDASAFWRGWLRQALTALIDELEDEGV